MLQFVLGDSAHPRHSQSLEQTETDDLSTEMSALRMDEKQELTRALQDQLRAELCVADRAPFRSCYGLQEASCLAELDQAIEACRNAPRVLNALDFQDLGSNLGDCVNDYFFARYKKQVRLDLEFCATLVAESAPVEN